MKFLTLWLLIFIQGPDLPFKPKDEFEIKLNYQFKQRPQNETGAVYLDETQKEKDRRTAGGLLPYLILNVKVLKVSEDEVKVKIQNNLGSRNTNKKVSEGSEFMIDMGFTEDVKDRVTAYEYTLTFISPKKTETSKIIISVADDGTFTVNGEKRGKF